MGFFSDLKEDLSQAVEELVPEEGPKEASAEADASETNFGTDLSDMLDKVDEMEIPEEETAYAVPVADQTYGEAKTSSGKKLAD